MFSRSSMNRSKYQVSCFSKQDRISNPIQISNLSKQNYIRSLSERKLHCTREACYILPQFFLIDNTFFRFKNIFDWIFNGQNMFLVILINFFNHCSKSGRFSRSCCSSQEYNPIFSMSEFLKKRWKSELFERWDFLSDESHYDHNVSPLSRNIDSVSSLLVADTQINTSMFFKKINPSLIHQRECDTIEHIIIKLFKLLFSDDIFHYSKSWWLIIG